MPKHDALTADEFQQYRPPKRAVRQIDEFIRTSGLAKNEVRLLDWGCGRGRFVLWLLENGYNACGVDIDSEPIRNGLVLFEQKGFHQTPLTLIKADGRTTYPDAAFDFIMTDNVLEHVQDLPLVLGEIDRLTAPHGGGYHIFPAQRQPREGHLFMPFVHWLPKNTLRKAAIRAWVKMGREPHWEEVKDASLEEKSEVYYRYSLEHLHYRPYRDIRTLFKQYGFTCKFIILQNPAVQGNPFLRHLSRFPLTRPILNGLLLTFKQVEMVISRSSTKINN